MKTKLAAAGLAPVALLISSGAVAMSTASAELDAALRLTPRLDHGAEIFDTCAACHGQDGHGVSDGSVPAIAGQFVPVIVKQIVEFRYNARLNVRMQHFVDRHHLAAPQDLADVAAYVSSLPPREGTRLAETPRLGQAANLFAGSCASCHGRRGEGSSSARVPRLAGQYAEYLNEQLHDAAEGRRPSMGPDHARLLTRLSSDDMDALARYLAGIALRGETTESRSGRD
jgi:cytochrome c553